MKLEFVDNETGLPADKHKIGKEDWLGTLSYKLNDFALTASGQIIVIDQYGCIEKAPTGRFTPRIVEE